MIRRGIGVQSFVSAGGTPPVNTVAPVISGTQVVGQTLSTTNGTWTGDPAPSFTYQWYRGATLISGATSSTYVLVQADAGNTSNITCQVTGTNVIGSATATSNTLARILDADANSFLTAASISDNTQINACNTLTIDLKGYGIWTKMKAIYPFVGGTSSTHKWNLKDPRDLDAAFRLVFSGGLTHNSNGITGNGVNSYADTFLVPSTTLSTSSGHISTYIRNNVSEVKYDLGSQSSGNGIFIISRWQLDSSFYINYGNLSYPKVSNSDSRGLFVTNRNSTTNTTGYKNGVKVIDSAQSGTLPTNKFYIGALGNGSTGSDYASKNYAFASIGNGLTDAENTNLYTAVQAYQTTLGRQV